MGVYHSFDIDIATEYGMPAAVLLCHINHWIRKNEANGVNYHDGKYWTYNSIKAFNDLFPYMSEKVIRTALQKLETEGLIETGNYNVAAYDRTTWYALTQKGKCICTKGQMDLSQKANGFAPEGKPIPDINTDIKPNNNNTVESSAPKKSGQRRKAAASEDVEELFESLWRLYPRKEGKRKVTNDAKNALAKAGFDKVAAAIAAYKEQIERNKTEDRYVKHGSTFFNGDWQDYVADNDAYIKSAQDYVNGGFESY